MTTGSKDIRSLAKFGNLVNFVKFVTQTNYDAQRNHQRLLLVTVRPRGLTVPPKNRLAALRSEVEIIVNANVYAIRCRVKSVTQPPVPVPATCTVRSATTLTQAASNSKVEA